MLFSKHTPALLWPDQVVLQKLIVREVKDAAHPALAWIAQVVRTVQSCSEANHQQVSVSCFCPDCGVFHFPSKYKRSEDCFMILFHRGSKKRLRSAVNIADLRCN